jgi:hypothetical protein
MSEIRAWKLEISYKKGNITFQNEAKKFCCKEQYGISTFIHRAVPGHLEVPCKKEKRPFTYKINLIE